jgi:hypothetical protein
VQQQQQQLMHTTWVSSHSSIGVGHVWLGPLHSTDVWPSPEFLVSLQLDLHKLAALAKGSCGRKRMRLEDTVAQHQQEQQAAGQLKQEPGSEQQQQQQQGGGDVDVKQEQQDQKQQQQQKQKQGESSKHNCKCDDSHRICYYIWCGKRDVIML